MATKNVHLLETLSSPNSSPLNKQFKNLNLNQNFESSAKQCDTLLLGSKSEDVNGKQQWNNGSYTQTGYSNGQVQHMIRKFESKISLHSSDLFNKKSSKVLTKTSSSNSTLSLHIAAYENSFMAQKNDNAGDKTKKFKAKCDKMLAGNLASPFEFPRQQDEESAKETEPEIMQFKASQKLMSPNSAQESTTAIREQQQQQLSNKTEEEQPVKKSNKSDRLKAAEECQEGEKRAQSESDKLPDDLKSVKLTSSNPEPISNKEESGSKDIVQPKSNSSHHVLQATVKHDRLEAATQLFSAEIKEKCLMIQGETENERFKNKKLPDTFKSQLHEYKFLKAIGKGSYAWVFEAEIETGERVAFKLTEHADALKDAEIMKAAKEKGLTHFCDFVESGKMNNQYYFVMKLLGPDLEKVVDDNEGATKKLSKSTKLILCKETFKAIYQLHQIGCCHGDISESNFAVGRPGTAEADIIKILDFQMSITIKDENEEEPGSRKDDLIQWITIICTWNEIEFAEEFYNKKYIEESQKENNETLGKVSPAFLDILIYLRTIKIGGPIDYDIIFKSLDRAIETGLKEAEDKK